MPRDGHLAEAFHIFAYLEPRHASRLVFDPTYPYIDDARFNMECDWKPFYGDVQEQVPDNAPPPRGKPVVIRVYVDSDHAGDRLTRRSRTGYIIYLNGAPIDLFLKETKHDREQQLRVRIRSPEDCNGETQRTKV
jgi:hypothetical protein